MTELEKLLVNERQLIRLYLNQLKQNEITQSNFVVIVERMLDNTASFELYCTFFCSSLYTL